nr:malonate decarboxylase holo-ACP synthase [Cupriavidus gilardii]
MAGLTAMQPTPHDLLWLRPGALPAAGGPWPDWADGSWLSEAPVVVRRDARHPGLVSVGVRGHTRGQRHAAWIAPADIVSIVTPRSIARQRRWRTWPGLPALPAIVALDRVAAVLDDAGLDWGVGGSVGFALASGIDVLRPSSDVDVVVHAPAPLSASHEGVLASLLAAGMPVDIQVATPHGGFSWRERHRTGGRVLLKTGHGPVLCDDPWAPPA